MDIIPCYVRHWSRGKGSQGNPTRPIRLHHILSYDITSLSSFPLFLLHSAACKVEVAIGLKLGSPSLGSNSSYDHLGVARSVLAIKEYSQQAMTLRLSELIFLQVFWAQRPYHVRVFEPFQA